MVNSKGKVMEIALQENKGRDNHVIYFPTKLEKNQYFKCKLTLGSQYIEACDRILSFLNENEMKQMVQESQFGNLIRFSKDYMNSNQLLWFLMSRQNVDCGTDEFWMVINKRPLRFSLLEYSLITGLNCSRTYSTIPKDDGFRIRHFSGMSTISLSDLQAKIDDFGEGGGEQVNSEKIKLASLYFVSAVLGPRRKRKKEVVDPQWVRLVDDIDTFNKYPWGNLAYDEAVFGLRKDLVVKFEGYKKLVKKRKRDPKFSGFASLHITGFVHPLQILAYEVFDGVGESFAIRREDGDVSLPRMCHWVTKKWSKSHSPSLNDVTNALSSFQWEDMSGMLTPTAAELLSAHYLPADFTVSNKSAVTRRISELMSRGLKVVCSQHSFTDEQMDDVAEDSHSPSTSLTHIIQLPRSPPRRIPVPHSPPPRSPHTHSPPRSSPPRSPPPRNPPPPSPSHLHRLEVRLTRVEETLTVIRKEHSGIMDILRHFQSDILSLKKIIEDEIAQSLVNTVGDGSIAIGGSFCKGGSGGSVVSEDRGI